jgi:protein-arginine kinase activator protein McsA
MDQKPNRTGVQSVMQRGAGGSYKDSSGLDAMAFPVDNSKFNTRSMMRRSSGLIGDKPKGKPMFEEQKFCQLCNTEFKTLIKKRHHCRTCGKSVCGKC